MNSRKKGTGSEVNITLTMIWCQIVIQLVHMSNFRVVQYGFLLHFDTDNCLLKKFHYILTLILDLHLKCQKVTTKVFWPR
jgi:hypothetical protein